MKEYNDKTKSFGYKLGHMYAGVLWLCLSAITLALAAKFIHWMLF